MPLECRLKEKAAGYLSVILYSDITRGYDSVVLICLEHLCRVHRDGVTVWETD